MSTATDAKAQADRLIAANAVSFPAWKQTNAGLTAMGFARASRPVDAGGGNAALAAARGGQKRGK